MKLFNGRTVVLGIVITFGALILIACCGFGHGSMITPTRMSRTGVTVESREEWGSRGRHRSPSAMVAPEGVTWASIFFKQRDRYNFN